MLGRFIPAGAVLTAGSARHKDATTIPALLQDACLQPANSDSAWAARSTILTSRSSREPRSNTRAKQRCGTETIVVEASVGNAKRPWSHRDRRARPRVVGGRALIEDTYDRRMFCAIAVGMASFVPGTRASTPDSELPVYLRDRGTGIATSMFGTYVRPGELLVYPFVEYYRDHDAEYSPQELGYELDQDFRGEYRAIEGLIFLGYGFTDRFAMELEAAVIDATQKTARRIPPRSPTRSPSRGSATSRDSCATGFRSRTRAVPSSSRTSKPSPPLPAIPCSSERGIGNSSSGSAR